MPIWNWLRRGHCFLSKSTYDHGHQELHRYWGLKCKQKTFLWNRKSLTYAAYDMLWFHSMLKIFFQDHDAPATCNQSIVFVKLSPASAIWLQTNSEKVLFTLKEFSNKQSSDMGNYFNFNFRQVFIALIDNTGSIRQNEKRHEAS